MEQHWGMVTFMRQNIPVKILNNNNEMVSVGDTEISLHIRPGRGGGYSPEVKIF